jgi:hypothetical protein
MRIWCCIAVVLKRGYIMAFDRKRHIGFNGRN